MNKIERFLSPLRYAGGKAKQADWISDMFPDNMETFIEPFVGGGSVSLKMVVKEKANKVIINDFDIKLYNFWKKAKENNDYFVEKAIIYFNYKEMMSFEDFKIKYWPDLKENIDNGINYYLVNRMGFNGLPTGISRLASERFNMNNIDKLKGLKILLKNVDIYNLDYEALITEHNNEATYLYLDPPYLTASQTLYKDHAKFDHERLANVLKNTKCKWILSYDDCKEIREFYKDFNIIEKEWAYGMTNNGGSKTKKGQELIISNFYDKKEFKQKELFNEYKAGEKQDG